MKQGYFVYNSEEYPTGTIIKFKDLYNNKIRLASFIYYDTEKNNYTIRYEDNGKRWTISAIDFTSNIQSVTDKFASDIKIPEVKQLKDSKIDGMVLGWVWYIFIMLIGTIFVGAPVIWVIVSVVFFSWRHKKIKEEGNCYEW